MSTDGHLLTRHNQMFLYDKLYSASRPNKTPHIEALNFKIPDRSSYEYVKRFALERLHQTVRDQLDFLIYINHCDDNNDSSEMENLSHNVFSWSYDEFLKRRQLDNCVWIEVMARNSSEECLEKQKFIADLKEVQQFMDVIFKAIYELNVGEVDLEKCVWKPLRDAEYYFNLPKSIQSDQLELKKALKEVQERFVIENVTKCLAMQQNRQMVVEDVLVNSDVWDPIEFRYEINWYQSMVKQNQYRLDLIHSGYANEIQRLKTKLVTEKQCGGSIMDTYYTEVEQYKRRINEFQERYDFQFDQYQNKNNYIQAQIDKIRDSKKFLSEEIERFHTEIQQRLEKEERERQAAELKRQEEEAAALALLEAKRQKKRKKGQNKSGPNRKIVKRK